MLLYDVILHTVNIERVLQFKFLGCIIDSKLSWCKHVEHVLMQNNKVIALLKMCHSYLPNFMKSVIYKSLFLSHLRYCILVWGSTYKSYLSRIESQHRKAIRLVYNLGYFDDPSNVMYINNIRTFELLHKFVSLCYFYEHFRPNCVCHVPEFTKYIIQRKIGLTTRHSFNAITVPSVRLTMFKHLFIYHVIKLWNSLPESVQNVGTLKEFKIMLVQLPQFCTIGI